MIENIYEECPNCGYINSNIEKEIPVAPITGEKNEFIVCCSVCDEPVTYEIYWELVVKPK